MNADLEVQALSERVHKLEAKVHFIMKHFDLTFVPTFDLDPADTEVVEWLKKKNDIKAVAAYRAVHMVGLAEAKAAVDEIRAGLGL